MDLNEAITSIRNPQKGIRMQTVVKQEAKLKKIIEPELVPESVKKVMQKASSETTAIDKTMSGNLSRLLDASSDCV